MPFLPGMFNLQNLADYLDVDDYAAEFKRAMSYISKHHIPPVKFLGERTPSISTASYSLSVSPKDLSSAARVYS